MRKRVLNIIKIIVSVGLIAYLLIFKANLGDLWDIARQAQWGYLLVATLLMIAGTALRAVRWRVLLQAVDVFVPLRTLVHLYFVGAFFNIFLPSGLGGDAVKMAKLTHVSGRAPESIGTTLVERATGLWVLFILALFVLPFSADLLPAGWFSIIAAITVIGAVGGWVGMGTPLLHWLTRKLNLPGQEKLERFSRSVSRLGYVALGKACLVSLIWDLILVAFQMLIARGLGIDQPLRVFILFTPIISFSLLLPISVGGLGVREQTYVLLYGPLGVPDSAAVAMSLVSYVITNLVVGLIGGLLYLSERTTELTKNETQS